MMDRRRLIPFICSLCVLAAAAAAAVVVSGGGGVVSHQLLRHIGGGGLPNEFTLAQLQHRRIESNRIVSNNDDEKTRET